jgi:uncharacterized protein
MMQGGAAMAKLLDSSSVAAVACQASEPIASNRAKLTSKALLTAEWRSLVMLNYEIEPAVLTPYVPRGTQLDLFQGRALVSVVGFEFLKARWLGLAIPGHGDFPEVNLRFYVNRRTPLGWRRGVVFIKEIAPRWMVAQVARRVYHENYSCRPMRHEVATSHAADCLNHTVRYEWREQGRWNRLALATTADWSNCQPNTEAGYIVERSWCYTPQPDGTTREYQIEHPTWRVAVAAECELACDVARVYGPQFVKCLGRTPTSAFLVDGSAVLVHPGRVV